MPAVQKIRDTNPSSSWINIDASEATDTDEHHHELAIQASTHLPPKLRTRALSASQIPLPPSPLPTPPIPQQEYREPQLIMPSMQDQASSSPAHRNSRRVNMRASKASTPYDSESDGKSRSGLKLRKPARRQDVERPSKSTTSTQEDAKDYLRLVWRNAIWPVFSLGLSVLSLAFSILKPILTIVLAFWLLSYLARYALHSTLSRSMSPICNVPGVSKFIPFCSNSQAASPVEFDQLMTVQSAFEDVLANSAGSQNLPLDMKRSEASIRDLRQVVQYSALPSRNELVFELTGFIDTARQAATDLTRFGSRIGRAVDQVASTNKWTLSVLDGMEQKQISQGSVERFLANTVFSPFQGTRWSEDLVLDQYLRHTRAVEEQIHDLILEAQALLNILQNLDDRLEVIHSITTRDGVSVKGSRDELFLELWTWLGGNRSNVKKHDEQLNLLQHLTVYRRTAWDHVSGTMLKLQSIAAELEDLRERVAAPDVLSSRQDIPLRLHIEHIQLGLDRLEAQRTASRQVEGEVQRKVLDRGELRDNLAREQALLLT
jgi:hypothetical protein